MLQVSFEVSSQDQQVKAPLGTFPPPIGWDDRKRRSWEGEQEKEAHWGDLGGRLLLPKQLRTYSLKGQRRKIKQLCAGLGQLDSRPQIQRTQELFRITFPDPSQMLKIPGLLTLVILMGRKVENLWVRTWNEDQFFKFTNIYYGLCMCQTLSQSQERGTNKKIRPGPQSLQFNRGKRH